MSKYNLRRGGFTLIELLVVIAILAILLALLTPSLSQAKALAVRAQCQSMERNMMLALRLYLHDFEGRFPYKAFFYLHSQNKPGTGWVKRWMTDYHGDGIGDYLGNEPGDYHCRGAIAYVESLPYLWGIDSQLPTYTPNRTIIPYDAAGGMPAWDRCAQKEERVQKPQTAWVFADGDWRGTFQAWNMTDEIYRFYWYAHLGGTNVAYLDGHTEWIHSSRNIRVDDWPSPYNPAMDWCTIQYWAILWK
jgi:prepilin-type N-terminal cleavage/methylation domain-containing protein/prepilin-type processing-associated H-X9-DG protein